MYIHVRVSNTYNLNHKYTSVHYVIHCHTLCHTLQTQSYVSSIASEDEANPSSGLLGDTDTLNKLLAYNKERIQTVINEWMEHYRQAIGIKLPTHSISRPSSTRAGGSHSRSMSSQSRMVRSCMSFTGLELMRFAKKPLIYLFGSIYFIFQVIECYHHLHLPTITSVPSPIPSLHVPSLEL